MHRFSGLFVAVSLLAAAPALAGDAQPEAPGVPGAAEEEASSLADFFGFEELEVIKVGRNAGPAAVADLNNNGLNDIIVVNNHVSRIEVHYQDPDGDPERVAAPSRVNEFPEHWRYRRENISVAHRVTAVVAHDFDGDGLLDLIYAGQPGELVFVRQVSPGQFQVTRRHRVRNLASTRGALAMADVIGDDSPELISLVDGEIHIWPLDGDNIGQPLRLSAGSNMTAFAVEDFNGNGQLDVVGLIPEDAAPVRMWFGTMSPGEDSQAKALGPQHRFEMPALRRMHPVRLPNEDAARLAVLEQASRRIIVYEVSSNQLEDSGHRDAAYQVHSFTDPGSRKRDLTIIDMDGDGLLDVITTDVQANAVAAYRQVVGKGLQSPQPHPSLAELDYIAAAYTGPNGEPELYVLSEREGVVGRSRITEDSITFPTPLSISEGYTPVALNLVELSGKPHVAVVARDNRNHIIDLLDISTGERETIELGNLGRSPETIVALDADQDGRTDLLLFTRDRPMMMLHAGDEGFRLLESRDMGQFGLVQAARTENTAVFDIDGNGHKELLLADRNYVRALRYVAEPEPGSGVSPGWQVVKQINAVDRSAQLVSIALLDGGIVAADRDNNRLIVMARDGERWREVESVTVRGFSFDAIHAGSFSGDGQDNVLAVGSDGFAVVRLAGERLALRETDAWRSTEERQLHHELASGDINNDGFTDLIALDAGEQMADIFTFTEQGRMVYATGFQIYESRIFTGGQAREFQPNQALIVDVTGNGAADLVMMAHDRVLIYPQMTREHRTAR